MSSPEIEAASGWVRRGEVAVWDDAYAVWTRPGYHQPIPTSLEAAIRADTLRNDPIVKELVEALRAVSADAASTMRLEDSWMPSIYAASDAIAAYEEATRA